MSKFIDQVKSNITAGKPSMQTAKGLGLKRTKIDPSVCESISFAMDSESHLQICIKASAQGVTPDELYRQIVWAYLAN